MRSVTRSFTILSLLAFVAVLPVAAQQKGKKAAAPEPENVPAGPKAIAEVGEIVDCSDFMFFGKRGPERREHQARNIDSGMPACFITDTDGEVYLLLELATQARERFQPTANYLGGGVQLEGVVYQKGSLKAISIVNLRRTGAYTDRESRLPENPQPNRHLDISDPKKTP